MFLSLMHIASATNLTHAGSLTNYAKCFDLITHLWFMFPLYISLSLLVKAVFAAICLFYFEMGCLKVYKKTKNERNLASCRKSSKGL